MFLLVQTMNFFGYINKGSQPCFIISLTSYMPIVLIASYNIIIIWNRAWDFSKWRDILQFLVDTVSCYQSSGDIPLISGEEMHASTARKQRSGVWYHLPSGP